MKNNRIFREKESLQAMRYRWELRGWRFTPLENFEGENEVINSLHLLKESVLCRLDFDTANLIDEIEELYGRALQPWEKFRTVFDCDKTSRDLLRWPKGTYSAKIRREARCRFWELKTTSRFSVHEIPNIKALQEVNWPRPPITEQHVASLAAMVCITEAIEALESVLSSLQVECKAWTGGKSFDWMAEHEPQYLEILVFEALKLPDVCATCIEYVNDALEAYRHTELWISQVDTLDFHRSELEKLGDSVQSQTLKKIKQSASTRASDAAKSPRKRTRDLTVKHVAQYFNQRTGQKIERCAVELAEQYKVSERTVYRRLKAAKEQNLLS